MADQNFDMINRFYLFGLFLCALCLSLGAAEPKSKTAAPRTVIPAETLARFDAHTNLTYARYGERTLALDLYRLKDASTPLPAIVCIHGGGWFQGDRSSMRPLAQALAARGFVAVTISYRLSGEKKFPAQIEDCKAAVRWLRANATKYGMDPEAIGVTGLSAGGHLAALLATSGGVKELEGDGGIAAQSSAVQAGIAMGAQSDLLTERIRTLSKAPENPHYRPFLGGTMDDMPKTYALASPRHHLDKGDPPLLFMTGELDDPSTHADEVRADLKRLGIPTGLTVIPQAPHGFLGQQRHFDVALEACDQFFSQHLKRRTSSR
jgi:arylsulfatase A